MKPLPILFSFLLLVSGRLSAAELPKELPSGGLAVVSGADAAAHALALAKDGRWLVRVITADPAQAVRAAQATAALHPLVTVSVAGDRLPFGPQSVNAILMGTGGPLPETEVQRVIAPKGLVAQQQGDAFRSAVRPADPRHAPWTDYRADAHGTGVSADTAVAPASSMRWFDQSFVGQMVRTTDGVAGYTAEAWGTKQLDRNRRSEYVDIGIHGIDVYSGVPLWKHPNITGTYMLRTGVVAHPLGFIHPQAKENQPAVLTDRTTGAIRVTYTEGLRMLVPWGDPEKRLGLGDSGNSRENLVQLVHGDTLVQIYGFDVAVLDVPSGRKRWGTRLQNPSNMGIISRDGTRLYLTETSQPGASWGRWGSFATLSMNAYDLASGKPLWRNADWATSETIIRGKRIKAPTNLSEIIDTGEGLFAWDQSSNIASDGHADLHRIDPATGAVIWDLWDANGSDPKDPEYHKGGPMTNNLVFWNGELLSKVSAYTDTGSMKKSADGVRSGPVFHGGNQRCVRTSGSANFLILGHTGYFSRDGVSYQGFLTRGNCAMPNYATYGAVLSVTDETCGCYNGLRGNAALVPEPELRPVADDQRLTLNPPRVPATADPGPLPESPIVKSWIPYLSLRLFPEYGTLGPADAGPVQLVVDVQRHLVTALRGGKPVWHYRADGRIHTLPTVHGGLAFVTTTAGSVTALDLATGDDKWTFLAALNREQVVVSGQLESRWPTYHTAIADGLLYVAAGRHVEVDGGIALWALDPVSGAIRARARIHQPLTRLEPGQRAKQAGLDWRGNRAVASRAIQPDGMFLNAEGKVCLGSRYWPTAATAKLSGMWGNLATRTKDRADTHLPDFTAPARQLIPVDLIAWNGRTLHPQTDLAQATPAKGK